MDAVGAKGDDCPFMNDIHHYLSGDTDSSLGRVTCDSTSHVDTSCDSDTAKDTQSGEVSNIGTITNEVIIKIIRFFP